MKKVFLVFLSLSFVLITSGCSNFLNGSAIKEELSEAITEASIGRPSVVSVLPAENSTGGVPRASRIRIRFSEPMDPDSFFYNQNELRGISEADRITDSNDKVFAIIDNDIPVFKNIEIFKKSENGKKTSLANCFSSVTLNGSNLEVWPASDINEKILPQTEIFVQISGKAKSLKGIPLSSKPVGLEWSYFVNSSASNQDPVINSITVSVQKEGETEPLNNRKITGKEKTYYYIVPSLGERLVFDYDVFDVDSPVTKMVVVQKCINTLDGNSLDKSIVDEQEFLINNGKTGSLKKTQPVELKNKSAGIHRITVTFLDSNGGETQEKAEFYVVQQSNDIEYSISNETVFNMDGLSDKMYKKVGDKQTFYDDEDTDEQKLTKIINEYNEAAGKFKVVFDNSVEKLVLDGEEFYLDTKLIEVIFTEGKEGGISAKAENLEFHENSSSYTFSIPDEIYADPNYATQALKINLIFKNKYDIQVEKTEQISTELLCLQTSTKGNLFLTGYKPGFSLLAIRNDGSLHLFKGQGSGWSWSMGLDFSEYKDANNVSYDCKDDYLYIVQNKNGGLYSFAHGGMKNNDSSYVCPSISSQIKNTIVTTGGRNSGKIFIQYGLLLEKVCSEKPYLNLIRINNSLDENGFLLMICEDITKDVIVKVERNQKSYYDTLEYVTPNCQIVSFIYLPKGGRTDGDYTTLNIKGYYKYNGNYNNDYGRSQFEMIRYCDVTPPLFKDDTIYQKTRGSINIKAPLGQYNTANDDTDAFFVDNNQTDCRYYFVPYDTSFNSYKDLDENKVKEFLVSKRYLDDIDSIESSNPKNCWYAGNTKIDWTDKTTAPTKNQYGNIEEWAMNGIKMYMVDSDEYNNATNYMTIPVATVPDGTYVVGAYVEDNAKNNRFNQYVAAHCSEEEFKNAGITKAENNYFCGGVSKLTIATMDSAPVIQSITRNGTTTTKLLQFFDDSYWDKNKYSYYFFPIEYWNGSSWTAYTPTGWNSTEKVAGTRNGEYFYKEFSVSANYWYKFSSNIEGEGGHVQVYSPIKYYYNGENTYTIKNVTEDSTFGTTIWCDKSTFYQVIQSEYDLGDDNNAWLAKGTVVSEGITTTNRTIDDSAVTKGYYYRVAVYFSDSNQTKWFGTVKKRKY